MKYPHILAAIRSAKWAVKPETLQSIRDVLSARMSGRLVPHAGEQDDFDNDEDGEEMESPYEMAAPGVAVVEMRGIIGKNLSSIESACGGCDLNEVEENLVVALADASVSTVILSIDSPGGTVSGVMEFAECIGEMSRECGKPVWAYIGGQGCSAAYWIACGCAGIAASPSCDAGSIGVYMALMDESENWAQEGYKLVLIKAGEFKAAGISGSAITAEQVAIWQADVDLIYSQFTAAVRAARPSVKEEAMQGQSFYGPRALDAGLVDQLMSLEEMATEVAPRMVAAPLLPSVIK